MDVDVGCRCGPSGWCGLNGKGYKINSFEGDEVEFFWEVQLGVFFKGDFHSTVGVCGDGSACSCRYSDQVPDLDVVDLIDL